MAICFVIQPFDNDKFDKRFKDTFKPAIKNADLEAYRVDTDLSVRVPITDIEQNISEAVICLADITIDNPNVWYELGFAFACKKEVVLICSDERIGKFPFDIQHRQVIMYKTGSASDFKTLEDQITAKIKALLQSQKTIAKLNSTPVADREGLNGNEIAIVIIIAEHQFTNVGNYSVYGLKNEMGKAGYNDIATAVGLRTLAQKGMLTTAEETNYYSEGEPSLTCSLTLQGENWLIANQDKIVMRKSGS